MVRMWFLLLGTFLLVHPVFSNFQDLPIKDEEVRRLQNTDYHGVSMNYNIRRDYPTFENIVDRVALIGDISKANVSAACEKDISLLVSETQLLLAGKNSSFTGTLLSLLDSSGKPGAGILRGNVKWFGLYKTCQSIKTTVDGRKFEGRYNLITFTSSLSPPTVKSCAANTIQIDLCLPKSCLGREVHDVIDVVFEKSFVCKVLALNEESHKANAGTYIVAVIVIAVLALGVLASIYDYFLFKKHKGKAYTKTLWLNCFRSFSLYTNVVEIFNTKGSNKPGNIGPLHCMRFFSMCWVILGHSMSVFAFMSMNPLDVFHMNQHRITEVLTSAFFAVDTFFWQSGLLLSFVWYKKYKQNQRQSMSPLAWTMFYVHRIIRLSPPYYILIAVYTWLYVPFVMPGLPLLQYRAKDPCTSNWWIDFLYLNNVIRYEEQCYLVSWYLSTDLQMYIFAPLILVPFTFGKIYGIAASVLIFAISTGANIFEMFHYYFPPTDYAYATMDHRMKVPYSLYTALVYDAPWIRCQIYIVGMLTGFFLQSYKKLKIPWVVQVIGWVGTAAIAYGCIFTLKSWINGDVLPLGWATVYSAASKPLWGVALSWIVITCYYGYGSFINSFMSWSIWVPLGRLTYSAYLVHIMVVLYLAGQNQQPFVFSDFFQMLTLFIIPSIVCAYLFAIIWSSAFEFAFGKLETVLIGSLLGKPGPVPVRPRATTLDPPIASEPPNSPVNYEKRPSVAAEMKHPRSRRGTKASAHLEANGLRSRAGSRLEIHPEAPPRRVYPELHGHEQHNVVDGRVTDIVSGTDNGHIETLRIKKINEETIRF
uniref:NRF domain-containing protein n=1 Tax=Panagrellus redivivus TaxID=6233 RepID=A0A7E4VWY7_PANRE